MRLELKSLRLRNAKLEAKCGVPSDGKVQTIPSQVGEFLNNLADTSSAESDGDEQRTTRTTRGRCHSLKSGK